MEKLDAPQAEATATTADPQASQETAAMLRDGLSIDAYFCPSDVADPFDTVQWELRTAAIKGEGGEVIFEQTDCEIPATWSQ